MRIFLLNPLYNEHGESDWATVYAAEEVENDDFTVDWTSQNGPLNLESPVPVSLSDEMPLPDFALLNHLLVVFDYKSERIQSLFRNSQVEWIPCAIVASYDEDTYNEIELTAEHAKLNIAIVNPLVRCRVAPGAKIVTVGDRGFFNELESIDQMSLYVDELELSDVFMVGASPMTFVSVAFKKAAKELGITGIKFERLSTLTS